MFTRYAIAILFMSACLFTAHASYATEVDENIKVSKKHFECLVGHIADYHESENDPILIFLEACPDVNPDLEFILSQSTNHLPSLGTSNTSDEGETDVISLTKEELACLEDKAAGILQTFKENTEYVQLPVKICAD